MGGGYIREGKSCPYKIPRRSPFTPWYEMYSPKFGRWGEKAFQATVSCLDPPSRQQNEYRGPITHGKCCPVEPPRGSVVGSMADGSSERSLLLRSFGLIRAFLFFSSPRREIVPQDSGTRLHELTRKKLGDNPETSPEFVLRLCLGFQKSTCHPEEAPRTNACPT